MCSLWPFFCSSSVNPLGSTNHTIHHDYPCWFNSAFNGGCYCTVTYHMAHNLSTSKNYQDVRKTFVPATVHLLLQTFVFEMAYSHTPISIPFQQIHILNILPVFNVSFGHKHLKIMRMYLKNPQFQFIFGEL